MKKIILSIFLTFLISIFIYGTIKKYSNQKTEIETQYLWKINEANDMEVLGDDKTGTKFFIDNQVVKYGDYSVKVIPSDDTDETKIDIVIDKGMFEIWNKNDSKQIILELYIPEESEVPPSMFFLGLADVTNKKYFKWIDGVFSYSHVQSGWNDVYFFLSEKMNTLKPDKKYKLFFAFAGYDEDNDKVALSEEFYINGIFVGGDWDTTRQRLINSISPTYEKEVKKLLRMPKYKLIESIERKTFDYFWYETNRENGLVKDRSTLYSHCSIAAVGFALSTIPVAIERKWIDREKGYERVLTTLRTFAEGKVDGEHGFFYHFVNIKSGKRVCESELSSVDTAFLVAGALFVGEYFKGTEVEKLADQLYRNVDWQWFTNDDDFLTMGWTPEKGFNNAKWNVFNEGILAYILAIGSPTYPLSADVWDKIYRPINGKNYIFVPGEPLFAYQYPHIWIDFRKLKDSFANYWNNTISATRHNYDFSMEHVKKYKSYEKNLWGLSACDGPLGYRVYGASGDSHDGTIAPYAPIATMPLIPRLSFRTIRKLLKKHGPLVWERYGFVSAYNVDLNWYSKEYIGIDQGDILLMLENYRSGLIWKYVMKNEYIQEAVYKIGFTKKRLNQKNAVNKIHFTNFRERNKSFKKRVLLANYTKNDVIIDARLNEWDLVNGYLVSEDMNVIAGSLSRVNKKSQILHSQFYIQWDDKNLYITANVSDNIVVSNILPGDQKAYYRTDSVEFYIDPSRADSTEGIMKLAVLPFDLYGNIQIIRHEDNSPGPIEENFPEIKGASIRTETGYIIELSVPFKYLGVDPKPGMTFGFGHTIHNSNDSNPKIGEDVRDNIISWNNISDIWFKEDLWSDLILED